MREEYFDDSGNLLIEDTPVETHVCTTDYILELGQKRLEQLAYHYKSNFICFDND